MRWSWPACGSWCHCQTGDCRGRYQVPGGEPQAYSWSGDDATSVFTCTGDCGYRIVFGVTPPKVGGPPG